MTAKEQLLQEIESASNELIEAILAFLKFAKAATTQIRREPTAAATPPEKNGASHPSQSSLQDLFTSFDRFAQNLPPEELAKLPTDGAEQHDHYIYGTPKR
jgi:hypothetical protein